MLARLFQDWAWDADNRFLDVAETLRKAMSTNRSLKVHLANGYYDLATPHFATEYTFNRLPLPPDLRANLSSSYYEAGHMMYVQLSSLAKMKGELEAFIDRRHRLERSTTPFCRSSSSGHCTPHGLAAPSVPSPS